MVEPMNRQQRRQTAEPAKRQGQVSQEPRITAARQAHKEGCHAEAEVIYDQLLAENPRNADAIHFKGLLFYQHGRNEEAVAILRQAIKLRSDLASFHGNLANVLFYMGETDAAESECRKAIRLDKKYVTAYSNFSALLLGKGAFAEAETTVRRAISLQPNNAEAYTNLATILRQQGRLRDTEAAFHRALKLDPDYEEACGNLIFLRDFNTGLNFEDQQKDRREWAERFVDSLSVHWKPHEKEKSPDRRLRIGYVSGDFRNHSAAITFGAALFERDRQEFEVFCYMTSAQRDAITEKFENNADAWRPCWGLIDVDLDAQVRADKIDILVDLAGHFAGNRLPVFARKPVPIQITAWGHCTGTGMKAMDYILADWVIMPPEDAKYCAENVVELSCGLSFVPPEGAPDVLAAPSSTRDHVTFGCFNRIEKIVDETLHVWSEVLQRVPNARLVLKNAALDSPEAVSQLHQRIADQNIDLGRVNLMGGKIWSEHMAAFGALDIALDPFPNNGGVTTLETLWMGVPVIAARGSTAPSRVAASILTACGHSE